MINAAKIVNKPLETMRIAFIGAGASNVACSRLLFAYGVDPSNCVMVDSTGILGKHRRDVYLRRADLVQRWHLCQITNAEELQGDMETALRGADAVVSFSQPGPDVTTPECIQGMAKDAIVLHRPNTIPESWPQEAPRVGAAVLATGPPGFPTQGNQPHGFPRI